ncbi:MAG: DNA replication/repair protein RecF [Hyphomicrobiales bacterium]
MTSASDYYPLQTNEAFPAPASGGVIALEKLVLADFRNYATLTLEAEAVPIILTGPNGSGKTNLLEAISLLAAGRGLRGAPYGELVRHHAQRGWAVHARVHGAEGKADIGTAWHVAGNGESAYRRARQVHINGAKQKSSGALAHHIRMLWLTPSMDRLFNGAVGDRRRFLDRLVIALDASHGVQVQLFEKLMRERNRLLSGEHPDRTWLSGLEKRMAEAGIAIAASRHATVKILSGFTASPACTGLGEFTDFPCSRLKIACVLNDMLTELSSGLAAEKYRSILTKSRAGDAAAGRTLVGPHRSDLRVAHAGKEIDARLCSTGEQKALLIGIILAHARAIARVTGGQAPVMLLDEAVAHLDETRRKGLFAALNDMGVQAWMTGADIALFKAAFGMAKVFEVQDGALGAGRV